MARMAAERPEPKFRVAPTFEVEFPGASALATECFINIGYLANRVGAALETFFRVHGMPSAAAFNVLTILDGAGESLPPSVIAERLIVSRPTMTGILDSLARRGLVARTRHRTNGRMRLVTLTDAGRVRVRAIRPRLHTIERRLIGALSAAEQRQLLGLTARLQAQIPILEGEVEV